MIITIKIIIIILIIIAAIVAYIGIVKKEFSKTFVSILGFCIGGVFGCLFALFI